MSLILEALKKSEAERQLGRAPGLMSPTIRVSKRRGLSPWWGVLGLAVLIIAGAGWWVNREPAAEPGATTSRRATTASAPPAQAPAQPATQSMPDSSPPPAPEPASPSTVSATAPLPVDPDFASVERESMPVPAQPASAPAPRAPEPSPPADGVVSAPLPPAAPSTIPQITLPPSPAVDAAPLTAAPPLPVVDATTTPAEPPLPVVDTTPPPAPPAQPPLEALPTYAELMPDVRQSLPALKLSMHVYAAEPAGRFVLIDGKRLVQGDALTASLTLTEIRRDGAVLDFGGKRFLVPRP